MSNAFVTPMDCGVHIHQALLSMEFPRQEYWSGLPFLSPGDLPNPGIEPASPVLQEDSLLLSHQGSPTWRCCLTTETHSNGGITGTKTILWRNVVVRELLVVYQGGQRAIGTTLRGPLVKSFSKVVEAAFATHRDPCTECLAFLTYSYWWMVAPLTLYTTLFFTFLDFRCTGT